MRGEYIYDGDHWPAIEIDQLRDDLECAEMEREKANGIAKAARHRAVLNRDEYNKLKRTMSEQIAEANGELSQKSMVYLSLINEYERVVRHVFNLKGDQFVNPTINNLRKRGGLPV
jgi:hypothetical protein